MSELVYVSDVCKVIKRTQMLLKISESVKRNFTELGREGHILHMRFRELLRGVEKAEAEILRDYSSITLNRSKTLLSNLTFDGLLDLDSIARLLFTKTIEEKFTPKGFRFLSHLPLSIKEISQMVKTYHNLDNIIKLDSADFEPLLKNRSLLINEEIRNLREQILSGKVVA